LKTSPKHGVPFFIAPAKHSAGLMVVRLVKQGLGVRD
jgi:hypothetical protein